MWVLGIFIGILPFVCIIIYCNIKERKIPLDKLEEKVLKKGFSYESYPTYKVIPAEIVDFGGYTGMRTDNCVSFGNGEEHKYFCETFDEVCDAILAEAKREYEEVLNKFGENRNIETNNGH